MKNNYNDEEIFIMLTKIDEMEVKLTEFNNYFNSYNNSISSEIDSKVDNFQIVNSAVSV
jgi:hypothetical protein